MDRDKYNSGWTVNYDSYFQRAEDHCMKCYYDTLTDASLILFIVIVVLLLVPFHFEQTSIRPCWHFFLCCLVMMIIIAYVS
jgi:hypothetical protein